MTVMRTTKGSLVGHIQLAPCPHQRPWLQPAMTGLLVLNFCSPPRADCCGPHHLTALTSVLFTIIPKKGVGGVQRIE